MLKNDLVSIGFPTYKQEKLSIAKVLKLLSQPYENIELIISNNNPDYDELDDLISRIALEDSRVRYFKQERNIGVYKNFKFVLNNAKGVYFMWVADDDDFEEDMIVQLAKSIGNKSGCFCNYQTIGGVLVDTIFISDDLCSRDKFIATKAFLLNRTPSMIYGLYRRADILWYLKERNDFDWSDCYFIQKIILNKDGFSIVHSILFSAFSKPERYRPKSSKRYDYTEYFFKSLKSIITSSIPIAQKVKLSYLLFDVNFRSFVSLETGRKYYFFYFFLYKIYSKFSKDVPHKKLF